MVAYEHIYYLIFINFLSGFNTYYYQRNFNFKNMAKVENIDINTIKRFPKLIVFDLDCTLWPFWVDTHVTPPFQKFGNKIYDMNNIEIKYYPDVPGLLQSLKQKDCLVAAASRTLEVKGAHELLELLNWNQYFDYKEIFPASKTSHFKNLKKATGIDYKDMIFFDDEMRNIKDISPLGVTCIFVERGMTTSVFTNGLKQWDSKN